MHTRAYTHAPRRELLSHVSALRPLAALERLDVVLEDEAIVCLMEDEDMAAADELLPALPLGIKEVRTRPRGVGSFAWRHLGAKEVRTWVGGWVGGRDLRLDILG
jgi:hypothetical protein